MDSNFSKNKKQTNNSYKEFKRGLQLFNRSFTGVLDELQEVGLKLIKLTGELSMAMELITEEVYKIDKSDKQEEAFRNSSLMKNLNELNLKTFLSDLTNLALQPLKESLENPIIKETMDKLANIILVMQIYLAS